MCTVSWIHEDGGYRLFSNRDERHTRKPALGPSIHERCGIRFVAPIDGDHGGSWIAINQFGLSLCLLNRYREGRADAAPNPTSRGFLLIELIDCHSRTDVRNRIREMDLTRFQPFTLLVLEPGRPSLLIHWTGRERLFESDGEASMPLISSSYDLPGVISARRQCFQDLMTQSGKIDDVLLQRFHTNHFPAASAYSTCMHRPDARTVSFSRVTVSRDRIEFIYHPGSPCVIGQLPNSIATLLREVR